MSKFNYTGKEVCQGCKNPGSVKSRYNKDDLCDTCKNLIQKALASECEINEKYVYIRQFAHAYRSSEVNRLMGEIINIFNNRHVKSYSRAEPFRPAWGDNVYTGVVPEKIIAPVKEFLDATDLILTEAETKLKDIPEKTREYLASKQNEIYNEGVSKGRELLFSLNNGDITMEDFNKNINKY